MRDLVLDGKKVEMVTQEHAKTSVGTIQFGVYGTDQEFEFEVADGKHVKATDSAITMEAVRDLNNSNDNIRALQLTRIENSEELVKRFENSCQAWINLSAAYVNTGRLDDAKKAIEKALSIEPDLGSAKALKGRILLLEGDLKEAIEIYEEMAQEKNNIAARETVAILKLSSGELDSAIEGLKSAIVDDRKKRISLQFNLGVAYLIKGNFDKAISCFRKVIAISPDYYKAYESIGLAYVLLGLYKKAEKMFRIAGEINSKDPSARVNLSRTLIKQNKIEDAMDVLGDIVREFPYLYPAQEELAILKLRVNKPKEALVLFEKIVDAIKSKSYNGDISKAINNVGVAHICLNNYQKSEEAFKESLSKSNGENARAGENLVRLYFTEKRVDKAKETLDELLLKHPNNLELLNLLATYHSLVGEYEKSMEVARNILDRDKFNLNGASIIANILSDIYDKPDEAEMTLRPLEEKHGNNAQYLNNLAYDLLLQDKIVEAEALLNKIKVEDEILNPIPVATRGLLFIKKGNIPEGTRLYSEAARLAGDKAFAGLITQKRELELGRWYLKTGDIYKAKQHFNKVLEIDSLDKAFEKKAQTLLNRLNAE